MVRRLAKRGESVIAACREASKELRELSSESNVEIVENVDVTSDASVAQLVAAVGERDLDVLINNAGILRSETLEKLDINSIREQLEVNALGPLRVTAALRARLSEGSKIGIVTSRMGSLADNTSGSRYGYRMSKAAVNMAGVSLAHDLENAGIAVALVHPGFVKTDMTGRNGNVEPAEAAAGILARIDALTVAQTGRFWHANGEQLPW